MSEGPLALRRLDRLIWTMVTAVTVVVLLSPVFSDFYLVWTSFGVPVAASLALGAGAFVYRSWRPDPRLASGLECTAQLIAFAAVGAPLSYLAVAVGAAIPLQDPLFDGMDHALGFDWLAMLRWLGDAPVTFAGLRPIYGSLLPQMTLAVLCLAFTGRLMGLRIFMLAFMVATLVTIAISAVLPAAGVWLHYRLVEADAPLVPLVSSVWPVFTGLRDGSVRALVAAGAEGVITFPSLHSALAVMIVAALWPICWLRWPVLAINLLMLVATPIDGAHYLVDVLAGVIIAALSLMAAHLVAVGARRAPQSIGASKIPQLVPGE